MLLSKNQWVQKAQKCFKEAFIDVHQLLPLGNLQNGIIPQGSMTRVLAEKNLIL